MIYRFGSGLYYANGARFTEEIMDLVENADPPLRWLAVSGSAMGDVDYSGADTIRQVKEELARTGVTFAFCDLNPKVRGAARRLRPDGDDRDRPDLRHGDGRDDGLPGFHGGGRQTRRHPPRIRHRPEAERARVAAAVARRAPGRR